MRNTTNINLMLYDSDDKMNITGELNSLNHNMEIIDEEIASVKEDFLQRSNGWSSTAITLFDTLLNMICFTDSSAGTIANALISELRNGGEVTPTPPTETNDITQSGNILMIRKLANRPSQSGSVLMIN